MWVRRSAIRPVSSYARVPARALQAVRDSLSEDDDEARSQLDEAFERFERTQPALAQRAADILARPLDETALALGYFLTIAVWLAFDAAVHAQNADALELRAASLRRRAPGQTPTMADELEAVRLIEQARAEEEEEARLRTLLTQVSIQRAAALAALAEERP